MKGLTFTTFDQTIRFINQLREIGDQLKGSIFAVPMGVKLNFEDLRGGTKNSPKKPVTEIVRENPFITDHFWDGDYRMI